MTEAHMELRPVQHNQGDVWARVTVESLVRVRQTEAELAEAFAGQPEERKREAYLAWSGGHAVGRLRLRTKGERCDVWAAGLSPAAGEYAAPRLLAAIEAAARAGGARRLCLELQPGRWEGPSLPVEACIAAGYCPWKTRTEMAAVCVCRPVACDRPMRHPCPEDEREVERLAQLFFVGGQGAIDDEGETLEDQRVGTRDLLAGRYGELLADCSFVLEGDGEPAGLAILFRGDDGTVWLAEVVVHPAYRGRGYSRALIQSAVNACVTRGIADLHLMVTFGNVPAEGLYRRMGFAEVPGTLEVNLEKELA